MKSAPMSRETSGHRVFINKGFDSPSNPFLFVLHIKIRKAIVANIIYSFFSEIIIGSQSYSERPFSFAFKTLFGDCIFPWTLFSNT